MSGRSSKLSEEQRRQARWMYGSHGLTVEQDGQVLGVSRTSIDRALQRDDAAAARSDKPV